MTKQQESDGMAEQALNRFSHHAGEKPFVLIADDSRVVRVSLRNILKNDCQLIEAEDGEQAWRHLCENPSIELVFSDLSMPKLDGRGLLNKLRNAESKRLADLPFIVVTGNEASTEIAQELENLGATGMVNKPFDPALITSFITRITAQQQEEDLSDSHDPDPQTDFLDNTADRTQFMEIASRELSFAIRNKNELALALVHIDQFSEILDHYSEAAVEHILLAMLEIIRQHIHPDDTLAYLGTGRFAILRPASNAIGTRYLGRRILEDLSARHFYLGESDQTVSASIGISAPDIKPGTRLKDLFVLAEGRLTAAMDNGGGKVVDKGNENLTPVSTTQESSELSNTITNQQTDSVQSLTRSPTEIHRLAAEQVAEIKAKYTSQGQDTDELANELEKYKQALEELTAENRQLIDDVERWKKQSSEAEQLRRQLFEVESQHQQLKMKFSELQEANSELVLHNEKAELENRRLIDDEEERTASLRQAHHIVEDENRRLENQIQELVSRAEKAELESLKSNQLVSSLRENGNLLRMQLDQSQQQLNELQESRQVSQSAPETEVQSPPQEQTSQLETDSSEVLNESFKPELALTAVPEIAKPDNKPVSVHLFPEQDQINSRQKTSKNTAIPPFRVEPEPLLFKNRFNPSSFTIASIILGVLLSIGGIYLYLYMNEEPHQETAMVSSETAPPSDSEVRQVAPEAVEEDKTQHSTSPRQANTAPPKPTAAVIDRPPVVSDEVRMEKEWTLRQMAEEEFSRKLDNSVPQNEPLYSEEPEITEEPFQEEDILGEQTVIPELMLEPQPESGSVSSPEQLGESQENQADTVEETEPMDEPTNGEAPSAQIP